MDGREDDADEGGLVGERPLVFVARGEEASVDLRAGLSERLPVYGVERPSKLEVAGVLIVISTRGARSCLK